MKLSIKDYLLVAFQVVLFVLYLLDLNILDVQIPQFIKTTGIILTVAGLLVALLALLQLNKNLSPFPTPKSNSDLITSGLYKHVRHPIYSGLLLLFFGYAMHSVSAYKLIITLLLLMLFYYKSRYEEQKLKQRFQAYKSYMITTGRFVPKF